VASLGLRISKSEVSRICQGLDEQVDAFRSRLLGGRSPYLWLDAKVEKVRDGGRVVRKCLVLAYGVHETGYREVIGLDVGECETEAFWRSFLRSLVERGLSGVELVVSDAHAGLKNAIAQMLGCPWQRCTVVGIFPNDKALIRLAASIVIEQNDEWLVGRRYLSAHSLRLRARRRSPRRRTWLVPRRRAARTLRHRAPRGRTRRPMLAARCSLLAERGVEHRSDGIERGLARATEPSA
jgi:transposase-like protein